MYNGCGDKQCKQVLFINICFTDCFRWKPGSYANRRTRVILASLSIFTVTSCIGTSIVFFLIVKAVSLFFTRFTFRSTLVTELMYLTNIFEHHISDIYICVIVTLSLIVYKKLIKILNSEQICTIRECNFTFVIN